jgi:hypothetical protein
LLLGLGFCVIFAPHGYDDPEMLPENPPYLKKARSVAPYARQERRRIPAIANV